MLEAEHIRSEGLAAEANNNLSERLEGTYYDRIKTLCGLDNIGSRQRYLNCGTITYNLFRGHHSLGNDLPAQPAKVNPPFREWVDVAKVTPSLQSL